MTSPDSGILPYSYVVGQDDLKMSLELAYIAPRIGGVLISGERGTAKSTAVRAFALMMYRELPVTLPLNATDDRVLGGYRLTDLMTGDVVPQPGLLEQASEGMLYVDEVNLLDDHIVNIILDAAATGVLTIQREAIDRQTHVAFTLIGTMNPEEGGLRPQLLDRFGLHVSVGAETDPGTRAKILSVVMQMDEARSEPRSDFVSDGRAEDARMREKLVTARERLNNVAIEPVLGTCAAVAAAFEIVGHRGDITMALASRALAALEGHNEVSDRHVMAVAPLALQHRKPAVVRGAPVAWSAEDQELLESTVADWGGSVYADARVVASADVPGPL
jgi:magnesium chelatase subunit I